MSLRADEVTGLTLVTDLGRPGLAHLGITGSGAADRGSLVAANEALANTAGAAALEIIGALALHADAPHLLALAGAPVTVTVDGVAPPPPPDGGPRLVPVPAGALLRLAADGRGLRAYLAVAGGFAVPTVLGSAARDVLSGLGPDPVRPGDALAVGPAAPLRTRPDAVAGTPPPGPLVMLDAHPGPRVDRVDLAPLWSGTYRVTEAADRVGTRLRGPALAHRGAGLASEGVVRGAVQVPPDGQPLVFGPDHPVTGGYPVVAVLSAAASDALAQCRAGQAVRFRRAGAWPQRTNES